MAEGLSRTLKTSLPIFLTSKKEKIEQKAEEFLTCNSKHRDTKIKEFGHSYSVLQFFEIILVTRLSYLVEWRGKCLSVEVINFWAALVHKIKSDDASKEVTFDWQPATSYVSWSKTSSARTLPRESLLTTALLGNPRKD